jgi:HK97 family phage portal protein
VGLREVLFSDLRFKALSASPEVLEAAADRRLTFFPLIATPRIGDQVRAAYERAVAADYGWMYSRQPAVRAVVDFMARNVAQLALRLYERTSDIERHEASDHPAAATMRNPNPATPGQKLIFDLVRDHLVYGNAFALKSRLNPDAPLVLSQLPPFRISVIGPSYFTVDAYRVYRVDGTHFDVPPEDILHWPGATNPQDPRIGLSPLETLREVLAEDSASQKTNVELMKAGLTKPGYLKRPLEAPEITKDALKRLQEDWANQQKDATRHTPLLEEGMSFEDFGITPKDAQMLDGRRFTVEEVCRVYGVPKGLLGIVDAGTALADEHSQFYADVLPPICEMLASYLDLSILQAEYDARKFYFEFDLDEKLQGDERLKALTSASGAPVLTRNESRAKLNLPPKEGGDDLVVPLNVTVGGKPSPAVMPVQNPVEPAQDGSHRNGQSVRALGKGGFDPDQLRDPHSGEWIDFLPDLPRRPWMPSNLDAEGNYHVYHGTTAERAAQVRESGALKPSGGGTLALTTSREQARQYAEGYAGDPVVLHFAIPGDDAARFLYPPEEHNVYGHEAEGHRIRNPIPAHYLRGDRKASMNGRGKALLLAHQKGQRQRRDRYASEFTEALRKFFTDQERSMRSKAAKDFDLERWVKTLTTILKRLMRRAVEHEGEVAAARFGLAGFAMSQVENYLAAAAEGKANEINIATRDALLDGNPADVFAEAKDIRAQGTGSSIATQMANFAQTEAAKQTPDASHRFKTWLVHDLEKSAHPEMHGERTPLTERFSNGKEYPPYEHPGCECLVSVT